MTRLHIKLGSSAQFYVQSAWQLAFLYLKIGRCASNDLKNYKKFQPLYENNCNSHTDTDSGTILDLI